jgi:general transcription factor 3C polypeptide 3 (transcription factor C subunit 4)
MRPHPTSEKVLRWRSKETSSADIISSTSPVFFCLTGALFASRLVETIRLTSGTSNTGMLNKDWDFNIEDKDAEFRDDLREASGIGRQRKKVLRTSTHFVICLKLLPSSIYQRSRRSGPALSVEVRSLIGDGNSAYVDNNIPEAIRIMQEVIRIEPRAVAAWSVLAQCYADSSEPTKALQLRIMAAHLSHDAEEWERLARQSRFVIMHV